MVHSETALLLTALLFTGLPLLVCWAVGAERGKETHWWCSGSLMVGTGLILASMRPNVPVWLSHHLANTILLWGVICWIQSLQIMLERPWSWRFVLSAMALAWVYYSALFAWAEPFWRGVGVRFVISLLSLQIAFLAWRLSQANKSLNTKAISVCFGLISSILLAQATLQSVRAGQPSPFSGSWDASVLALSALVTAVVSHICFLGMVLDRSTQRRMMALEVRVLAEESAKLDSKVHLADRRRRMLLVSGSLAHELNQPLTAALAHAQMGERLSRRGKLSAQALRDLLGKVSSAMLRACAILDRVREASQSRELTIQALDLRDAVKAALGLVDIERAANSVTLESRFPDSALWCQGDEVALAQVLVNLLRNALQASTEAKSAHVLVCCGADEGQVWVKVQDQGSGVPQEVLKHLGDPFMGSRNHGLGLGLAISQAVIGQHQGSLSLRNNESGGAVAEIRLPRLEGMQP